MIPKTTLSERRTLEFVDKEDKARTLKFTLKPMSTADNLDLMPQLLYFARVGERISSSVLLDMMVAGVENVEGPGLAFDPGKADAEAMKQYLNMLQLDEALEVSMNIQEMMDLSIAEKKTSS